MRCLSVVHSRHTSSRYPCAARTTSWSFYSVTEAYSNALPFCHRGKNELFVRLANATPSDSTVAFFTRLFRSCGAGVPRNSDTGQQTWLTPTIVARTRLDGTKTKVCRSMRNLTRTVTGKQLDPADNDELPAELNHSKKRTPALDLA